MDSLYNRPHFFEQGLHFQCQRCGVCCTGEPGIVYVNHAEVIRISHFLDLEQETFIKHYLYPFRDSYSIREDPKGNCYFYNNGCAIYSVRPAQCKTYPFWFHNLQSKESWRNVAKECPGVGKGRLYKKEEILSLLESS
ncbi:MAG: YkgJ family cysteine cluster protein [bacterium]